MNKTSKVTKAEATGRTWEGKYGVNHVHYIKFENGDEGEYNSKSPQQDKFKEGEVAEYDITPREGFPDTVKPVTKTVQQGWTGGKSGSKNNLPSFALSYAKDLAAANIKAGKDISAKDVTKVADVFLNWLKNNEQ